MAEAALVRTASVIAGAAFYAGKQTGQCVFCTASSGGHLKCKLAQLPNRWCMQVHEHFTNAKLCPYNAHHKLTKK